MKQVLIITLLFIATVGYSQHVFDSTKVSVKILQTVNKMVKTRQFGSGEIGLVGKRDNSPTLQDELFNRSTIHDFLELVNHPSSEIRYIAFKEVALHVDTFNFMPYIIQSFVENRIINTTIGCFPGASNMSDLLINLFKNKMTGIQQNLIDSILIFQVTDKFYSDRKKEDSTAVTISPGGPIIYREKLLFSLPLEERYYLRLKIIQSLEMNPLVIYSILRYNKPEDSTILFNGISLLKIEYLYRLSQMFWCCKAIYENPHDYYFKSLKKVYADHKEDFDWLSINEKYMYFLALSQYKNKESLEILSEMIHYNNDHSLPKNSQIIWFALQQKQDDYFKPMLDSISISDFEIKVMHTWYNTNSLFNNRLMNDLR